MDLHNVRETYRFDSLEESKALDHPIDMFKQWYAAYSDLGTKDANAMVISTVGLDGTPQSRVVLLKEVREEGLVFYTNYASAKGEELLANPRISVLFFWREQERQVRFSGTVEKVDESENEAYFATRPYLSQIGAAASQQSQPIESREALEAKFQHYMQAHPEGSAVPKPASWGGYLVRVDKVEFWQGREGRLHDRLVYTAAQGGDWSKGRLQP